MEKEGSLHPKKMIYKSNPLITGAYTMSNRQQRLIAILAAQVEDRHDVEFHSYTFEMDKLSELLGIEETERRYEFIRDDLRGLMGKVLSVQVDDDTELLAHFVSIAKLHRSTMRVEMKIHEELRPYYLDLKNKFTRYELGMAMKFRGTYTLRFYEWLKSKEYKKTKGGWWYVRIELAELRRRLDLEPRKGQPRAKMPRWFDFRRRVLEPAIGELNDRTGWIVNWEAVKWSRHIGEVIFHVGPKKVTKRKPPAVDEIREALKECSYETQKKYEQKCTEEAEKIESVGSLLSRETIILTARDAVLEEMAEKILAEAEARR